MNENKAWQIAHLGDLNQVASLQINNVAVSSPSDATLVERHDVLRERSCLIGENILNLSQLLIEGGGSCLGERFGFLVEHLFIPVDLK